MNWAKPTQQHASSSPLLCTVSPAFNATQSQSAQSNNAEPQPQRAKPSAASMAGVAPALVQKQAGQNAGLPTGFMEIQHVRHAQN